MRDNRIETVNKETGGFAIMMIGIGIWLATWILLPLMYFFGQEGIAGLIAVGGGTMLGGMGMYFAGREERIKRY